jgi:probable rRNA maturation factor
MAIVVDLQNDAGLADAPTLSDFERWVAAALQDSHAQLEQTICVVDEAQSRELNHRFRGKDSATNVLAFPGEFPSEFPGEFPGDNDFLDYDCLGDLVICAPLVAAEALQQGKPVDAHWAHLVVHGMLHLQGFDHQSEEQASSMEALEIEILDTLGYTNPYNV